VHRVISRKDPHFDRNERHVIWAAVH
jgi:hypothetical protein